MGSPKKGADSQIYHLEGCVRNGFQLIIYCWILQEGGGEELCSTQLFGKNKVKRAPFISFLKTMSLRERVCKETTEEVFGLKRPFVLNVM